MKMIQLKATTTNISSEGITKSIRTTYGNYMEYLGKFLAIKDCNLHQILWKNSQKCWGQKDNYQQHTILKQMVKQKG